MIITNTNFNQWIIITMRKFTAFMVKIQAHTVKIIQESLGKSFPFFR